MELKHKWSSSVFSLISDPTNKSNFVLFFQNMSNNKTQCMLYSIFSTCLFFILQFLSLQFILTLCFFTLLMCTVVKAKPNRKVHLYKDSLLPHMAVLVLSHQGICGAIIKISFSELLAFEPPYLCHKLALFRRFSYTWGRYQTLKAFISLALQHLDDIIIFSQDSCHFHFAN